MGGFENDMFDTVQRYKILAEKKENQASMIKDPAVIQFLVYALEGTSSKVTDTAMTSLELLAENQATHTTLRSTYGVMEALESIGQSSSDESNLPTRARILHRKLEESRNLVWQVPKTVTLFVSHLSTEDCADIWQAVATVPGVISCNFNVEDHLCTLTVFSSLNPQLLVQVIRNKCGLESRVVYPGTQSFLQENCEGTLPSYLSEEDSPIAPKKAVARRKPKRRESNWFTRAASMVVDSFFW